MKMKNLFVLAAATLMLVACGEKPTSKETPVSTEAPVSETVSSEAPATSVADSKAPAPSAPTSAAPATSPTPATSATPSTSANPSTSTAQGQSYKIEFFNTMATCNNTTVGAKVKEYINGEISDGFVTNGETDKDGSVQVQQFDDIDRGQFRILQIGSGSKYGALTLTFSQTIKSVILDVENFNRRYTNAQTGEPGSSQDTKSLLYVNSNSNKIDLAATAGNPNRKVETVEINSKTLKLYNDDEDQRVFVNSITFVL